MQLQQVGYATRWPKGLFVYPGSWTETLLSKFFFFVFVQQTIVNVAAILLLVLDSKKKLNILCITYVLTSNLVRKKVTFFSS